ncbi:MAG: YihY/virulence factor BrkB family protein [Anaerolineales bacterium]|jgi:membrane protein
MDLKQTIKYFSESRAATLFQNSIERWQSVNSAQLAAALAYHTIFSLAPLLIISIYIAGLWLGQADAQAYVAEQIQSLLGPEGTEIILSMIRNLREGNSGLIASMIGLGTVIFGATRVFNQLEITLNILFESKEQAENGILNVLQKRALSFAMMASVSLLLLISLLFSTALSVVKNLFIDVIPQWEAVIQLLNYSIPVFMATALFAVIFKFLPEANLSWHNTLTGGFFTAILFTIGQLFISYYLGNSSISSAYGAAGSLLVILVWIYYSAHIFYFGAAFTKEYSDWKKATV